MHSPKVYERTAALPAAGELSAAHSFPIFQLYTAIGICYCSGFGILFSLFLDMPVLGLIHFAAGMTLVVNDLILIRTRNFVVGNQIVLAAGTTIIVSLFVTGGWANYGHLWAFAYLPYAFYLAGHKRSFFWVGLLYALMLGSLALDYIGVLSLPYAPVMLINYWIALFVFTLCLFLLQFAIAKYAKLAQDQVRQIQKN